MIITVNAIKGGVGKTTLSTVLAELFNRTPGRTACLADLDPQGSAYQMATRTNGISVPVEPIIERSVGKIPRRLRELADQYDTVLVDTPPGHIDIADAAIGESDLLLIPTQPEYEPLRQALTTFKDFEAKRAVIVLNKVDRSANDAANARALINSRDLPIMEIEIPNWVSIKRIAGAEWRLDPKTALLFKRFYDEVNHWSGQMQEAA